MGQGKIQRNYLMLLRRGSAGYSVRHSVVYREGSRLVMLSAPLSQQIIRDGLRWLSGQATELKIYATEVAEELQDALAADVHHPGMLPDRGALERRRFSLN